MAELKEKLRELRGKRTLKEFAALIGENYQNIQRYENGVQPKSDFFDRLRRRLNIDINYFFGSEDTYTDDNTEAINTLTQKYQKNLKRVPILGFADCGLPSAQWTSAEQDFIIIQENKKYKQLFGMRAAGRSMEPYILPNDILIGAPVPFENIKDYSAIIIIHKSSPGTSEANAKLFYRDPDNEEYIFVYSQNTKYPPQRVKLSSIIKIYKVVKIERDVN